ncbi:MAG: PA0069 family radical SAM protein [Myxococcales bacterium]|nr:PA0069 family radical SAM protein [Myxococcales bacterium]
MRALPVLNPPSRFLASELHYEDGEAPTQSLDVYEDHSRQILSKNDSPDVPFSFSVNPYRGCMHACAYCYARPTHEYLSFGAGTDFDRKLLVKPHAAELLREAFHKPTWRGEPVAMSGVTDCYQPLEAKYQLTRALIEVCVEYQNPFLIVTKSPLIERDIDLLAAAAERIDVRVAMSIPILERAVGKALEPGVPPAERRFRTIERLAAAKVPVGVLVAPIIPGLTDDDAPRILEAARAAGARFAGRVMLRLPGSAKDVFLERLRRELPAQAERVIARIKEVRGGRMNDSTFGRRGQGEGPYAESVAALFDTTAKRLGYEELPPPRATFERPLARGPQLALFR